MAERALRLTPADPNLKFQLATIYFQLGDRRSEALLTELSADHDVRELWSGLAAIRRMLGDLPGAAQAAAHCLSRHALFPAIQALVTDLASAVAAPGWCGLTSDGHVVIGATNTPPALRLDARAIAWRGAPASKLPDGWQTARRLTVRIGDVDLLGSPIDIAAIRRLEAFVTLTDAGLTGWAWHPADPDQPPELTLLSAGRRTPLRPADTSVAVAGAGLLARPRGFVVPPAELDQTGAPVRVLDRDGRDLPGSPLHPAAAQRAAAALASAQADSTAAADCAWLPLPVLPAPPRPPGRTARRGVVVVLVAASAEAAVEAVPRILATTEADVPVIVAPLVKPLDKPALASQRVTLLDPPEMQSWAAAAAAGLRRAAGRDVALLDAGCAVAQGWLAQLRTTCLAAADIGSASPLGGTTGVLRGPADAAPAARQAAGIAIALPSAHCVYLRRDCLEEAGALRWQMFPQAATALADLALRAAALGWRHMAAPGVVVAVTARRDGPAEAALAAHSQALLSRLHPGLERLPAAPALDAARRRLAAAHWRRGRAAGGAVLLITHADGGGVERHIRGRCEFWRAAGRRPVVLRPAPRADGPGWCVVEESDLRFRLPDELPALASLLRAERPTLMEVHHLLGHHHAVLHLARLLDIPHDVFIHDHAWFCPRILLVGRERRYCGEPDLAGCEACVADLGHALEEEITVGALRQRSAADLGAARRVVAPSQDTALRLRRHFPKIRAEIVPWEEDGPRPVRPAVDRSVTRVCVAGAIGLEKGFEVLLDCARDAKARALALEFVVVGHTLDDARLLDTGRVFITGAYQEAEAVELVAAQAADIGFIPSVWPETWCYALSNLWAAGLPTAAFQIGAPAERIARDGRGTLLPLGLHAGAINNALLAYAAQVSNDPPRRRAGTMAEQH